MSYIICLSILTVNFDSNFVEIYIVKALFGSAALQIRTSTLLYLKINLYNNYSFEKKTL